MQEDKNLVNFKKWLPEVVPYFEKINEEEMKKLFELYEEVEISKQTLDNIFDMAFNHNSAHIDYGNDFSKVMERINRKTRFLDEYIKQLENKYVEKNELETEIHK